MFTTAGLMPPNLIVIFVVLIIFLASVVAARSQPAPALGWWLGVALVSLPFVLVAMPAAGAEWPPGHPPLTSLYNCVASRPLTIFASGLARSGGAPIIAKPQTTNASAAMGACRAVGRSGPLRRSSVPAARSWPDAEVPVTITLARAPIIPGPESVAIPTSAAPRFDITE